MWFAIWLSLSIAASAISLDGDSRDKTPARVYVVKFGDSEDNARESVIDTVRTSARTNALFSTLEFGRPVRQALRVRCPCVTGRHAVLLSRISLVVRHSCLYNLHGAPARPTRRGACCSVEHCISQRAGDRAVLHGL